MAELNMDLTKEQEYNSSVVPSGEYVVKIISDEVKTTSTGKDYINFQYKVIEGDFTGRYIFDPLYIFNSSEKAKIIAKQKLKSMAKAIGHPNPNYIKNTSEFLGHEMKVKVRKVEDDYGEKADVKRYIALAPAAFSSEPPVSQPETQTAPQPEAPKQPQTAPWEN